MPSSARIAGLEDLGLAANQVIDLVDIEEVDAHAVLTEEHGLGRGLVGADAFGLTRVRDFEEAGHVTTTAGHITHFEGDLLAFFVFREVDEGESSSGDEVHNFVDADSFADFELDHRGSEEQRGWRAGRRVPGEAPLSSSERPSGLRRIRDTLAGLHPQVRLEAGHDLSERCWKGRSRVSQARFEPSGGKGLPLDQGVARASIRP